MSEIDPRERAMTAFAGCEHWHECLPALDAEGLAVVDARLAQPTVTRDDIHQAIWNLLNERGDEDDGVGASEITDAVMAVIAPDTAGGVGDGQGN